MHKDSNSEYDPIVRIKWVADYIGVNVSTIWRWRNSYELDFPEPLRLGKSSCGWRKSTIENWLKNRPFISDE